MTLLVSFAYLPTENTLPTKHIIYHVDRPKFFPGLVYKLSETYDAKRRSITMLQQQQICTIADTTHTA